MFGFRPNRGCHDALKSLNRNIENGKVNYVVDADIKGYFDHINHEWLIKCVEQHIKDSRIIRMIKRFLKAGIIENTVKLQTTEGTQQGSILSPVLANIYMYYVIALWFEKKIKTNFKGECYVTIYGDDTVFGFQYKNEAELFVNRLLPKRLAKFNLELATEMIKQINIKLKGHYQYYGITDNGYCIKLFERCVNKLLWKWLCLPYLNLHIIFFVLTKGE